MRLLAFIFALFLLPAPGVAQQASTMRFEHEEWDFGVVNAADGAVSHTFTFTNTGREAFVVERVSTNCNCTTPEYSTHPIAPRATGTVTVRFDPTEKPAGAFEQNVRIASLGGKNRNVLTIRGTVVPRPRSVEEDYPYAMGDDGLRLAQTSLNFGYVEQGAQKTMSVALINNSLTPIALSWNTQPEREFFKVDAPPVVGAGQRGEIAVSYDLRQTEFYGRYSDRIYLTVNGVRKLMPLSTTFTAVDAPVGGGDAPRVEITPLFHNHGTVGHGEKLTRTLEIRNVGRRPLVVRWVNPRAGMTTTLSAGLTLQRGEAQEFTVTMNTGALGTGVQSVAMTVITNDPARPLRDIRSAATVR
jgi:hypothetical protein